MESGNNVGECIKVRRPAQLSVCQHLGANVEHRLDVRKEIAQ